MATVVDQILDEKRAELEAVKQEQQTISEENADRRFDDVTRSRFNELEESKRELEAFIAEKEKVNRLVERNAESEHAVERASFQTARPGSVRGGDIYDLSTIQRDWARPEVEEEQYRDRALRAIERASFPHERANHEDTQTHLERMLEMGESPNSVGGQVRRHILNTGSPAYKRAFTKALAGQRVNEAEAQMLERAASLTAASGGYAVPFVLDPTVIPTSSGAINPYRAISSVETISVDEWRGVSSDGVTATFQAEAAAVTDASPTLAQPTVSTEMARAFIPYTIEVGMDWSGFAGEMSRMIQDGKDTLEATKFAVGSGTNEPFGVITGATTVFTASNTNSLVVADIYGVHNALGPRFRRSATWSMNNSVADRIRQLDTAGGANLWVDNLQLASASGGGFTDARMGPALLGHAVYEASGQSGTFTTGQLIAVVGDFSYFKIIDRIGLTVENIPHLFGAAQGNLPTGMRGLFGYWRVGSKVLNANAFRTLKLA